MNDSLNISWRKFKKLFFWINSNCYRKYFLVNLIKGKKLYFLSFTDKYWYSLNSRLQQCKIRRLRIPYQEQCCRPKSYVYTFLRTIVIYYIIWNQTKFHYGIKAFCKDTSSLTSLHVNKMKNTLLLEISSKVLNVAKIRTSFLEHDCINMFAV